MITVSQDYKDSLSNKSLSPKSKIIVDGVEYLGNVIKTFPKITHQATKITGCFPAKTLNFDIYDFDGNIDFQGKEIEVYKGIVVDNEVEYVKQGVFIPKSDNISTNITTKIITFNNVQDRTQLLDTKYESSLDYSNNQTHTGLEIVQEICTKRSITLKNNNFAFANYSFPQPNFASNITEREVISRLAEIGGEIAFFDYNGDLTIKGQTNTGETISRGRYEKISEEKTVTFNTVVLGKEGIDDDIVYPSGMAEADRVSYKILDNPFVDLIRQSIIAEVGSHIIGLTYMPYELTGFIDGYIYELNDIITINDRNETSIRAVIFDYESTSRIKSNIKLKTDNNNKTNYNLAGSNQRTISDIRFEVDHINNQMTSVIETVDEQNDKISTITQTVDDINSKISDISDITKADETTSAVVNLTDINESEPIMIKIHPTVNNISYLYPNTNLYPSSNLYLKTRTIRFYNLTTHEIVKDYILPEDLLIYSSEIYDEFYLDYDSQTCKVIKRCKYNADGTVSTLSVAEEHNYTYPDGEINLTDGDYQVSILGYDYGYLFVRLMAKNIYTTQFFTKSETRTLINQTAQSINLSVSQTLSNYSTTQEMNSAIALSANEINSTVSQKVGKNEVISQINQSAEQIKISASKINLTGYVTISDLEIEGMTEINGSNITTGTINADLVKTGKLESLNYSANSEGTSIDMETGVIDTKNFKVDNLGNVTANNVTLNSGTFKGSIDTSQNCTVGNNLYVGNSSDNGSKYIYFSNNNYIRRYFVGSLQMIRLQSSGAVNTSVGNMGLYVNSSMVGISGDSGSHYTASFYNDGIGFSVQPVINSDQRLKKNIKDIDVSFIDEL